MKVASRIVGKGKHRLRGRVLCGWVGLALLGWLGGLRPLSVSGVAEEASAAEEPAKEPTFEREVFVVYSVNNLGYIDTCG